MPSIEANSPSVGTVTTATCPLCDAPLDPSNPTECPRCDWVSGYRRQKAMPVATGRDIASVVMTIVPGLGHFYKGHPVMAASAFLGGCLAWVAAGLAATATMGLALALLPVYWLGLMLHVFWLDDIRGKKESAPVAVTP